MQKNNEDNQLFLIIYLKENLEKMRYKNWMASFKKNFHKSANKH